MTGGAAGRADDGGGVRGDDAARPLDPAGFHRLAVAAVQRLTPDAVAVTFEVPAALRETFRFAPGQHLTLRRWVGGQEVRRTYSVCASAVRGPLRIALKRLPGGLMSAWLVDHLRPGDTLEVLPPAGRFGSLPEARAPASYAALAAGSGITPVLSILTTLLEVEPDSQALLVYANRTTRDIMFLDDLNDLKDRYPQRFALLHVLSREEQHADLLSGRLDPDRLRRLLSVLSDPAAVRAWFLCGPLGLVAMARQTLAAVGVAPGRVHAELFHAASPPPRPPGPAAAAGEVTVVLHGRATTVTVDPARQSVLDAVLAVRADAPYACRSGVCGTCRARLLAGSVEMDRNYALEDDELRAGVVLTCQARPSSARVRLEYL